ncbi:hypothetical protein [Yoonia sp. 208BN28-4]|uniref:hypothetical protein n=1 Tax=Yoonia sp. 208BN28-4 TaxID=3126505 RepID=UPI0030B77CF4
MLTAGCGGSGGDTSMTAKPPSIARFDDGIDILRRLGGEAAMAPLTPSRGLPASLAQYSGAVLIDAGDLPTIVGRLEVDVDFTAAGQVSGTADLFQDLSGGAYSGTLSATGGQITSETSLGVETVDLALDLDGNLARGGGDDVTYDLSYTGTFFGAAAQYLSGNLRGTALSDGNPVGVTGQAELSR